MTQKTAKRRLPLDRDAWLPVSILAVLFALAFICAWSWVWAPALILLVFVVAFFRDPPRRVPQIPGAVVSPADGVIDSVRPNADAEAGPLGGPCVSIVLNLHNVHINRAPYAGVVEKIRYVPGKKLNAVFNPESAKLNESNWIYLQCGRFRMTVRQIAGLMARRIVCRVREGQIVRRGQRVGLIRFGSRTELYLPPETRVQVEAGQKVKGGLTVIAYLPED